MGIPAQTAEGVWETLNSCMETRQERRRDEARQVVKTTWGGGAQGCHVVLGSGGLLTRYREAPPTPGVSQEWCYWTCMHALGSCVRRNFVKHNPGKRKSNWEEAWRPRKKMISVETVSHSVVSDSL